MGDRVVGRGRLRRAALVATALVTLLAACGDDDDDAASSAPSGDTTATASDSTDGGAGEPGDSSSDGEPVVGGEIVTLHRAEIASLDPARAVGSHATDAMQMFSLYGALVVVDPVTLTPEPMFAESIEPGDGFTTWTITLRPGITFSDGAALDARAVQVNWQRIQDPDTASPAMGTANAMSAIEVVDDLTLEVTLAAPNSQFPAAIARSALNYLASPDAIESGHDLTNDPVGAGPFLLEDWTRDSRIVFTRNPDWFDAPRPYVDRYVMQIMPDPQQRVDSYSTGIGDGFFTGSLADAETAIAAREGTLHSAQQSSGTTVVFNVSQAPFDDVRLRRAFAHAYDRDVLADIVNPGQSGATNFAPEDLPWYTPDADIPAYDLDAAQELIDEIVAESGPIEFALLGVNAPESQRHNQFIQTSLNQLDGVTVELDQVDNATLVERVLGGDYMAAMWGFPHRDPEPLLYTNLYSGLPSNVMHYSSAVVDEALDAGRATDDPDERAAIYAAMFTQLAQDLPYIPSYHSRGGYVLADDILGVRLFADGGLRTDQMWRAR